MVDTLYWCITMTTLLVVYVLKTQKILSSVKFSVSRSPLKSLPSAIREDFYLINHCPVNTAFQLQIVSEPQWRGENLFNGQQVDGLLAFLYTRHLV
jgi:hypothetical protein